MDNVPGRQEVKRKELSGLDRNLELLAQEIALRGSRLFSRTTSAVCASASVSRQDGGSHFTAAKDVRLGEGEQIVIRERTARDVDEVRICPGGLPCFELGLEQGPGVRQYLAMRVAGATAKNGGWDDGLGDWNEIAETDRSATDRADFIQDGGRGWEGGGSRDCGGGMQAGGTVNRYRGRGLL